MPDFGLKDDDLISVTNTLRNDPQILGAAIFGSRAKGDYKPWSDVDIVLYGNLNFYDVERVVSDLEELPLVYKFDVVAYQLVKNPEFRRHIDRIAVRCTKKEPTRRKNFVEVIK